MVKRNCNWADPPQPKQAPTTRSVGGCDHLFVRCVVVIDLADFPLVIRSSDNFDCSRKRPKINHLAFETRGFAREDRRVPPGREWLKLSANLDSPFHIATSPESW